MNQETELLTERLLIVLTRYVGAKLSPNLMERIKAELKSEIEIFNELPTIKDPNRSYEL